MLYDASETKQENIRYYENGEHASTERVFGTSIWAHWGFYFY
jgi:hypothetical protein